MKSWVRNQHQYSRARWGVTLFCMTMTIVYSPNKDPSRGMYCIINIQTYRLCLQNKVVVFLIKTA